ncbi:MAG: ATP-binding protein [Nanoarchaeota archaeon]|nr:ATP-binding protein [Nanoarchaeota archaeon]
MPTLHFTVDSALLEELGERLVGKPYIALAELIKNSFDADASKVEIFFEPENDRIIVSDNGHGMNLEEFTDYWMRIGSTHKEKMRISRNCLRKMTGSKGVGRLSVQYLARELKLVTVSDNDKSKELVANVKWDEAVRAGNLTEASVEYEIRTNINSIGTKLILHSLKQEWKETDINNLAEQLWWLQPPFRGFDYDEKKICDFNIIFYSTEKEYEKIFNEQLSAILNIWYAKIVGKNINGEVNISLEFKGQPIITEFLKVEKCEINFTEFEIRIYKLQGRQDYSIKVGEARDYLLNYGGVHVYDGGFHLPFYGDPKNDWLKIEFDHSHRLSLSPLLPSKYHIERGLQFLPTLSRIIGIVKVDTSQEKKLEILITRDRLQESLAFEQLRDIVRWSLDFYAYHEKIKNTELDKFLKEVDTEKPKNVEDVIDKYKDELKPQTYNNLKKDVILVTQDIKTESQEKTDALSLIGPLATAGITSIAVHHEIKWQVTTLDDILIKINTLTSDITDKVLLKKINDLKNDLNNWVKRTKRQQSLYSYFLNAENIQNKDRFVAKKIIEEVISQLEILSRGVEIDIGKIEYLLLPRASLVEWGSIFQNVLTNAFNAMLDSNKKLIKIRTKIENDQKEILIQDTGVGVDLMNSEELFLPFVRKIKISYERMALGYGGTGLGLTIVKLIANNIGCQVSFVEPEKGFNTAFSVKWSESK